MIVRPVTLRTSIMKVCMGRMRLRKRRRNQMTNCKDCKHWKWTGGDRLITKYDDAICGEIYKALTIDIHAGWDGGTVGNICTESGFGCVLGEAK
jgi:hypothetical protein